MQLLTTLRRGIEMITMREGNFGYPMEGEMVVNGDCPLALVEFPQENDTAFAWIAAASTLTTTTTTPDCDPPVKKEHRHATTGSRKKVSGGQEPEDGGEI
jgi:hypothetical protein